MNNGGVSLCTDITHLPSPAVSRWSNRPERLLRELQRTIGSVGLVKCPCSPKTRQLHSFLQIKQALMKWTEAVPSQAKLHQQKKKWRYLQPACTQHLDDA